MSDHWPLYRNFVHFGAFVIFAPILGWLADPHNRARPGNGAVVAFLLLVTVLNMFVLPRLESGRRIARPNEPFVTGQWLYPLSLAICFAVYPAFAAMGAWAAMAAGDAAASLIGRNYPGARLPWNKSKSLSGSLAFIVAALPFCVLALYWVPCRLFLKANGTPEWPYVWTLGVLAASSGAILESLEGPFDDNVRVPLGIGAVLWLSAAFLSFATRDLPYETHVQPEVFLHALGINALLGLTVIALRVADIPGTLLGVSFGVIVYFFTLWPGYLLFLFFVAAGSGLSRVGYAKKKAIGAAEAREGKRGIANVAANLLIPVMCCLAYPASKGNPAFLIAFASAIAAAFADTASSEIGALSSQQPVLITNLKKVPHGTNGAVTTLGIVAAFGASVLIALLAYGSGFLRLGRAAGISSSQEALLVVILIASGMAGTLVDSVLGATVEDRYPGVGKSAVNFACTLTGAGAGGLLAGLAA
ncbi:MAG TPA: DUF92 domain-containing protein [Planctomycetota bacterium]|nr:DUF92 domain-containing protein [Planctomycetota bacterium]